MSKTTKSIIAVVIVLVVILGIKYSSKPAGELTAGESVKIGALFPLSGGLASYGEPSQKMAQIAVEEINAAGGIKGKSIVIDYQDHVCDAQKAVSIFHSLYAQGTRLFTASACSGTVAAVAPVLKDSVLLGTILSSPNLTGISPAFFRNYPSDASIGKLFAEEIKKNGYQKVAIINEETDYAKGLRLAVEEDLKGAGVAIVAESFAKDAKDVRGQLTKLKAAKPEVLFISPQTVPSGDLVLRQMTELNFRPTHIIVNQNILKSDELLSRYSSLLEGTVSADYVVVDNARLTQALAKYKAKYGVECPQKNICANVYDNIYFLAEAVEESNGDLAKTREYLKTKTYEGISGTITFDANNDRKDVNNVLFVIKNSKAVAK